MFYYIILCCITLHCSISCYIPTQLLWYDTHKPRLEEAAVMVVKVKRMELRQSQAEKSKEAHCYLIIISIIAIININIIVIYSILFASFSFVCFQLIFIFFHREEQRGSALSPQMPPPPCRGEEHTRHKSGLQTLRLTVPQ